MKKIMFGLVIIVLSTMAYAQMDNPLKEGMPNTMKLPTGEVIYDLNGEWDAFYDPGGGWETYKDIIKIEQNEDQFIGIYLKEGDNFVGKNKVKIKGSMSGNKIKEAFFRDMTDMETMNLFWAPCKVDISEDGNQILVKRDLEQKGVIWTRTLSLKRK